MKGSLDVGPVAESLPDLDDVLAHPRLRPVGLVGGFGLVLAGALLGLPAESGFFAAVVSGVLVFVGVPLFSVGLAAPEPADESSPFRLGVDLTPLQRRVVAGGAALVVVAPMTVAVAGPLLGFPDLLWLLAATVALVGSVLMLTGFVAWTSRTLVEKRPS
ncbi:hypothetical protein [Halomicrobium salinisoli]|uniref:hypothetical protein n=1 Tax=Halomicrobium salinisoli TaxID=2878391 RepID=UPI001CF03C7B|nr:hypothetical protein [Halomicrobium salinisoli]